MKRRKTGTSLHAMDTAERTHNLTKEIGQMFVSQVSEGGCKRSVILYLISFSIWCLLFLVWAIWSLHIYVVGTPLQLNTTYRHWRWWVARQFSGPLGHLSSPKNSSGRRKAVMCPNDQGGTTPSLEGGPGPRQNLKNVTILISFKFGVFLWNGFLKINFYPPKILFLFCTNLLKF